MSIGDPKWGDGLDQHRVERQVPGRRASTSNVRFEGAKLPAAPAAPTAVKGSFTESEWPARER
jgi:hypothetical protein